MAVSVLVGVQWGDEGKGKIIDVLTRNAEMVVRFQGGNNAGHTVETENKKFVLHLVPSGVLRKDTACVIGNGVVVDPVELVKEMTVLMEIVLKAPDFISALPGSNRIIPSFTSLHISASNMNLRG